MMLSICVHYSPTVETINSQASPSQMLLIVDFIMITCYYDINCYNILRLQCIIASLSRTLPFWILWYHIVTLLLHNQSAILFDDSFNHMLCLMLQNSSTQDTWTLCNSFNLSQICINIVRRSLKIISAGKRF